MTARRANALFLVLLLACAATLAFADLVHGHDGLTGKACQLCHAAHVPGLEASLGAHVPPPVFLAFHSPELPAFHHMEPDGSGGATRAPPASC